MKKILTGTILSIIGFNISAADFDYIPIESMQNQHQTQNMPYSEPREGRMLSPSGNWQPGQEWVKALILEYKNGSWGDFLANNHSTYQENRQKGRYNDLIKTWTNQSAIFSSKEGKQVSESFNRLFQQTKNELVNACNSNSSNQNVCLAINSIAKGEPLTQAQKESLDWLNQLVLGLVPARAGTNDQNIKDILIEYRLKRLAIEKPRKGSDVPHSFAEKELAILEMDKFSRLLDATQNSSEQNKKINDAYQGFLNMAQSQHDMRYLIDLGKKTRQPSTPEESKVAQVMSIYVKELKQLHDQEMAQRGQPGMPQNAQQQYPMQAEPIQQNYGPMNSHIQSEATQNFDYR